MKRREFIKYTAPAAFALLNGTLSTQVKAAVGRVVLVQREGSVRNKVVDSAQAAAMLDAAVEALFEQKADTVWPTLFSPKDTVGLKVNCMAGRGLSTNRELTDAVVERLRRAGVPASQIIIWDRRDQDLQRAGYRISFGGDGVQCYGNDRAGFSDRVYEYGSAGSRLSNILLRCTAVINLPVLKDHGIVGMSGALKNFLGAVNNPNKCHPNAGDPFIADLCSLTEIRRKTLLTVCDAFIGQYEGGPSYMPHYTWPMGGLLAGADMPALDRIIWRLIDEKRVEKGLPVLEKAGRRPSYVLTAAKNGLGVADLERIELVKA